MGVRIVRRLWFWMGSRRRAAELAAELEDHRARVQAALEADGIPAAEAEVRSRRAMGNVTLAREDARDVWLSAGLRRVWRDAVYGVRALKREPTFAATALLTLTLGSLTTITAFSIANAELWRPLPFPDAHRLVIVESERPGIRFEDIPGPDFADWTRECRLARYAAELSPARRVLDTGSPEAVIVLPVTTNFFALLGRVPSIGRAFTPDDERARVAILSERAWRRLFNGDRAVVGRTVTLDGEAHAIVGVTAGGRLEFRSEPDFFVPIDPASPIMRDRAERTLQVYGRVAPDATTGQAEAELRTVAARIGAAFPAGHKGETLQLFDLQEHLTGNNWRQLYFFLAGAVLLMVLSCLNVANLLLARALRRQREFAIRGALGGGTGALVRQLLVEGAVLALPGALAGSLGAVWLVRAFTAVVPPDLLERGGNITLDGRVAVFAIALTVAITIALALSPLVFARRIDLNVMLGHGARTAGRSPRQRAVRAGLLVAQASATLVLLAGAALFVHSFIRLTRTPLGFDPHDRVLMRLSLPAKRYGSDAARAAFADRWLAEARAVAGVREVAIASESPLTPRGVPGVKIAVPGRPRPAPGTEPIALFLTVSPRYFAALGIPLLDGRAFDARDVAGAARVVIVNELFAQRFFPGERAVGRTIEIIPHVESDWTSRPGLVTVVGVAGNVRNFSINEVEYSNVYLPFFQAPAPGLDLVAATAIPEASAVEPLRRAARRVDPGLPLASLTLGTERVYDSLQEARFDLSLITVFAALAIVVAGVGIYGSMACAVEERTREFGVRIALGAMPRAILADALRGSIRVGVIGCAIGSALVIALARVLGNALYLVPGEHGGMLYQVGTTSPIALGGACTVLLTVAIVAGLVPARRATRTDPLLVLREDY
jgi:putative ABC transport system permease protein